MMVACKNCVGIGIARALTGFALLLSTIANGQSVTRTLTRPQDLKILPMSVTGRVAPAPDGGLSRQWPGTYFETGFIGSQAYFRLGAGDVSLRVKVDDQAPVKLVKPRPGTYRVSGLVPGRHRLRIDVASESQAGPTHFGGFLAPASTRPVPRRHRTRAIEFIGDSHTVGYGNTSLTRACSDDRVWATTDTSRAFGALIAGHYDAGYQVNAISGRGVVRNYNGFAAPTLPEAYPYAMLDSKTLADRRHWHPQLVVISLGTNDFSTPLNSGEKWASREALHADFETTYLSFVEQLLARYPKAYVLLWATDMADGEIRREVANVVGRLRQSRADRVGFVPVDHLSFSACNGHPSLADNVRIARTLVGYIDRQQVRWRSANFPRALVP